AGGTSDRALADQDAFAGRRRQSFIWRQPAEGCHRQMAGDRAAGDPARRSDARGRYWRQAGNLRTDPSDVGRRTHCPLQLDGVAGANRALRPDLGPLSGPARWRSGGRKRRQSYSLAFDQYRRAAGPDGRDSPMTGVGQVGHEPAAAKVYGPTRARWRLPEETGVLVALIVMIAIIGLAKPRF